MSRQVIIILGEEHTAMCRVFAGIEEGGVIVISSLKQGSMPKSYPEPLEIEPFIFENYKMDDLDYPLELNEHPVPFKRKLSKYPKPIFKTRFIRTGNRGK